MKKKLDSIIVTGSNGGIGSEICKNLKKNEYVVIGLDLGQDKNKLDGYINVDLNEVVTRKVVFNKLYNFIKRIEKKYNIKALINNAAVQYVNKSSKVEIDSFKESMNVNVTAPLILVEFLRKSLKKNKGNVINIGSIHSRLTKKGFMSYSVSKTALSGLTNALSIQYGEDFKVNEIQPAAIETSMLLNGFNNNKNAIKSLKDCHPTKSIGNPIDIAKIITFLIDGNLDFLNGSKISIDGGISNQLNDL